MHDRADAFASDDLAHKRLIPDIADEQAHIGGHGMAETGRQIIEHADRIACVPQCKHGMTADIAGATCYEYRIVSLFAHVIPPQFTAMVDRESVASGKSVSVSVDPGGCLIIKKKKKKK